MYGAADNLHLVRRYGFTQVPEAVYRVDVEPSCKAISIIKVTCVNITARIANNG